MVNFWSALLPIIDPILATFGHYSLILDYFVANYGLHISHFWAKLILVFSYSQSPKTVRPYSSNSIKNVSKGDPIRVSPVMKMRPHLAAHYQEVPPSPGALKGQKNQNFQRCGKILLWRCVCVCVGGGGIS